MGKNLILDKHKWYLVDLTDADKVEVFTRYFMSEADCLLVMGYFISDNILTAMDGRSLIKLGEFKSKPLPPEVLKALRARFQFPGPQRAIEENRKIYRELKKGSDIMVLTGKNHKRAEIIRALAQLAKK